MSRTYFLSGALLAGALLAGRAWAQDPADAGRANALLSMEEQVDALKEQVFRAKATLQLLREIVAVEPSGGSQVSVAWSNRLGAGYTIEGVAVLLDGQARFAKEDASGALSAAKDLKVFEGPVAPGDHVVAVEIRARPTGYGIFQYARRYTLDVKSTYTFKVDVGKTCAVEAAVVEASAAKSFEDRTQIEFDLRCERVTDATSR
jgi:hypothetical protein